MFWNVTENEKISWLSVYAKTKQNKTKMAWWKSLIGTGIVATSSSIFCITNVIVKHLSHVDSFFISFYRFLIIALMASPVAVIRTDRESCFPKGKRWLLILRSVLGASNLMVHFYSLQVILLQLYITKPYSYVFCGMVVM